LVQVPHTCVCGMLNGAANVMYFMSLKSQGLSSDHSRAVNTPSVGNRSLTTRLLAAVSGLSSSRRPNPLALRCCLPFTMPTTPALPAVPSLSRSEDVEELFAAVLMTELKDFLIYSGRSLVIPSAISVARALNADAVNAAAPTEVYVRIARSPDQRARQVRGDCERPVQGGGAVDGGTRQAPSTARSATTWGVALPRRTGGVLQPLPVEDVVAMLNEHAIVTPSQEASSPPPSPPFFFASLQRTVSSGPTEGVSTNRTTSSEVLSPPQVAFLRAIHEHVRGIMDKLASRFILLKGITLVMAPDAETVKTAALAQIYVRRMVQVGVPGLGLIEPLTWALGDPDNMIPSTLPPPRIVFQECEWRSMARSQTSTSVLQ